MEDLFDSATAEQFRQRIRSVTPESQRQWGKMSAAQMMEHCARGLEMATGELKPPRVLIGRLLGRIVKPRGRRRGVPLRKTSLTGPPWTVAPRRILRPRVRGSWQPWTGLWRAGS